MLGVLIVITVLLALVVGMAFLGSFVYQRFIKSPPVLSPFKVPEKRSMVHNSHPYRLPIPLDLDSD